MRESWPGDEVIEASAEVDGASLEAVPVAEERRKPPRVVAAYAIGFGAALLALTWARVLHPGLLLLTAGGIVASLVVLRRTLRPGPGLPGARPAASAALYAALVLVAVAVGAGIVTDRRLDRVASDWSRLVAARETRLGLDLDRRMSLLMERGRRAALLAAARAARPGDRGLFADLTELRSRYGVAALAVFSTAGELVAWSGDHRGALPVEVRAGGADVLYSERPLFTYLYFSRPIDGRGGRAVAAVLLQSGLPVRQNDFAVVADAFEVSTGVRPRFAAGPGPEARWSLVADGDTLAHARFERANQAYQRAAVTDAGRRAVTILAGFALLLLCLGWLRCRPRGRHANGGVVLGFIVAALAVAPLGPALGLHRLFSPALFLVPLPIEISLGRILAVLLPLAALAATTTPPALERRRLRLAILLGAAAVAAGFAGGLHLMLGGAAPPLLEGGAHLWAGLQPTLVLLLAIVAGLALPQAREQGPVRTAMVGAGLALSAALALAVLGRWRAVQALEAWWPALWALPFVALALGLAPYSGRGSRSLRWLAAGWLATTVVIPHLWVANVDARLRAAERELATLGTRADPYLDYLLRNFAAEAMRRHESGEDGVELLYRAWVASGLASEAYAARVTLWGQDGRAEVELPLGGAAGDAGRRTAPPWFLAHALQQARTSGEIVVESARDLPGVNQILAVPLSRGRSLSVVVPPRRNLDRANAVAPFLGADPRPEMHLTLIPARGGDVDVKAGDIQWHATDLGWRSETLVRYPDGEYHAHLELRLPSAGVRLARGALILAIDLGLLMLLWLLGRAARGDPPEPPGGWPAWIGSFRARVTLALFAFFLLPTVLFGAVAYRALSGEVTRAARILAERAVAQAAAAFPDPESSLAALAAQTGEDVLYFHWGELISASAPEAHELGLYGAWMPPSIFLALQSGEELTAVETRQVAAHRPALIAYRRLQAAGALAVPVSLVASDAVVRQRELLHLVLFAAFAGGLLSLALSVAVGRALARPIGQLRRASGAVGGGQLGVHLPEVRADEFGELFTSFNRMVRRLRQARAQELRTARVLAWGEMARQVAHEIKNPLTPIKLSVQHLRRAYADRHRDFDRVLDNNVDQILAEIDRLTEIARAFSRYGAPTEAAGPLEVVDVRAIVREALTLYRAGEGGVHYGDEVEEDLPPARARPGELKEVLLNLLENAHVALDGAGSVVVSAARADSGITVTVRDDGPGIPPELLPRIFEPHFSTRSAGTGLGLAIVRRLVESWGGSVAAESEPGRGTAVYIRMQAAESISDASGS